MTNEQVTGQSAGAVSSRVGARGQARASQPATPKVLTAVLCDDELYQSSASDSVALLDVFDLPQLRTLGPMITKIRVHYVCEGASANFRFAC